MKLSEFIDKIYEEYVKVSKKIEYIEKVKNVLNELGLDNEEIDFDPQSNTAYAEVIIDDKRIEEIAKWLLGSGYNIIRCTLLITTNSHFELRDLSNEESEKAKSLKLEPLGYKQIDTDEYIDYFEILELSSNEVKVILKIHNYKN